MPVRLCMHGASRIFITHKMEIVLYFLLISVFKCQKCVLCNWVKTVKSNRAAVKQMCILTNLLFTYIFAFPFIVNKLKKNDVDSLLKNSYHLTYLCFILSLHVCHRRQFARLVILLLALPSRNIHKINGPP